jgi:hypothetical protein
VVVFSEVGERSVVVGVRLMSKRKLKQGQGKQNVVLEAEFEQLSYVEIQGIVTRVKKEGKE